MKTEGGGREILFTVNEGVTMREGLCLTNQGKVFAASSYNNLLKKFLCMLSL